MSIAEISSEEDWYWNRFSGTEICLHVLICIPFFGTFALWGIIPDIDARITVAIKDDDKARLIELLDSKEVLTICQAVQNAFYALMAYFSCPLIATLGAGYSAYRLYQSTHIHKELMAVRRTGTIPDFVRESRAI